MGESYDGRIATLEAEVRHLTDELKEATLLNDPEIVEEARCLPH